MWGLMRRWGVLMLLISIFLSLRNPKGETERVFSFTSSVSSSDSLFSSGSNYSPLHLVSLQDTQEELQLEYDFYREKCPQAEQIIRSTMKDIYSENKDISPALLRMLFHDCFIEGCDASVLLNVSNGDDDPTIEKNAIPNLTLKGFDKIDMIKSELEKACPGTVSCADILAGGPFYPLYTGRRDSTQSYYNEAMTELPSPQDNINRTLHLFALRGFKERETVSLLGAHNIGKIGCDFIQNRLNNFSGTGQPDPSVAADFLKEMMLNCMVSNSSSNGRSQTLAWPVGMEEPRAGMMYSQGLSSSMSSGTGFDTHYYESLLKGRGLLFADQQLMANQKTARLVNAYASDDGTAFRRDFARTMVKISSYSVLTGSQGQVRLNCSKFLNSN
ncbi:hypothetical protein HHK36_000667 [Tetracentron sinense]|uniref:Peroxidase n=1 Tax=Tetracentron sinense TaxID=13715 RepID=A0A835DU17_TETSI|nr:hypothetical protein HHK36_000667 [Tetracentron sinense]